MKKPSIKDLCFEITQKCPNNCIFCSSESGLDKNCFIDFDVFKNAINYFISLGGIEEISFSGGEPLLHPNIYEMVEYCNSLGIMTTLYTSGIVLRDKKPLSENPYFQKVLKQIGKERGISVDEFKKLENLGLKKVVFDLQAAEVDEYNALMGTKNNMANLLQSMLHASYCGFKKSIHFIPNKMNVAQFKDVVELAEMAEFDEVRILKFVPQGRGNINRDSLQINYEELENFLNSIKNAFTHTKIKIGIPLLFENEHKCTAGFDKLVVRYDGVILPCPAFKDIDLRTLEENGIKVANIFKNLEEFKLLNNGHKTPLCEKLNRHNERKL